YRSVSCRFRYPQRFLLYAGVYIFTQLLYGFTIMGSNCQTGTGTDAERYYVCPVWQPDLGLPVPLQEETCDVATCAEIDPSIRDELK
ncbi:hypothetical protein KIPB_015859, partial [Kipferlia bialata]